MTIAQQLQAAKKLIEKGWCKEAFARTKNGKACGIFSKNATNFCMKGALLRVNGDRPHKDSYEDVMYMENCLLRAMQDPMATANNFQYIPLFNDGSTKRKVLRAFDKAIELANAQR